MRRIKLNVNELQEYDAKVINKVMYLTPGVYCFRDFLQAEFRVRALEGSCMKM